jgi:hypothetical protein
MSFQIKVLRTLLTKLATKAGKDACAKEGVTVAESTDVVQDILSILDYIRLDYWVSMEEFEAAAVRIGLSRSVGTAVHSVLDWLL